MTPFFEHSDSNFKKAFDHFTLPIHYI